MLKLSTRRLRGKISVRQLLAGFIDNTVKLYGLCQMNAFFYGSDGGGK
jgi:hypothetical protein